MSVIEFPTYKATIHVNRKVITVIESYLLTERTLDPDPAAGLEFSRSLKLVFGVKETALGQFLQTMPPAFV